MSSDIDRVRKVTKLPDYMGRIEQIIDLQKVQKPPPKHVRQLKGKSHDRSVTRRTHTEQRIIDNFEGGKERDVHMILKEKLGRPKYKSSEL